LLKKLDNGVALTNIFYRTRNWCTQKLENNYTLLCDEISYLIPDGSIFFGQAVKFDDFYKQILFTYLNKTMNSEIRKKYDF